MKIRGDCVTKIFELDGAWRSKWLFEIHDILVEAHHCLLFLNHISISASARFGIWITPGK